MPIEQLKTYIQEQFLNNQYFTGLAGGLIITSIVLFFKGVPRIIWGHAEKFLIHSVRVNNDDVVVFKAVRDWCSANIDTKKRKFFSKGGGELSKELSYGRHYRLSRYGLLLVIFSEEELNNSLSRKESFEIFFYHWSGRVYNNFVSFIVRELHLTSVNVPRIYRNNSWGEWSIHNPVKNRSLDYIFIEGSIKEDLVSKIDLFLLPETQKRYELFGMNHRYGILLYGPPGTGKTSLIKALAHKYGKNLCYLNLATLDKDAQLDAIYEDFPKNSFLVIEDIDCFNVTHDRDSKDSEGSLLNISTVLSFLDGGDAPDGTIIIATTNHLDRLDPAIVREGRFDLKLELGEADRELAESMSMELIGRVHEDLCDLEYPVKQAKIQNILFNV